MSLAQDQSPRDAERVQRGVQWLLAAETPLSVACRCNKLNDVKRLLAAGEDPTAASCSVGYERSSPLYQCLRFGYAECLEALLTAQIDLVDSVQIERSRLAYPHGVPPLLHLLCNMAEYSYAFRFAVSDEFECLRLLLDAGASLEPVVVQVGNMPAPIRHDAFEYARESGRGGRALRMLEEAAQLRYSIKTHGRFPRPARYAAAELLRLGYQIESGTLAPVWAEHVLPLLVSRTSRGAAPPVSLKVLFIDALDDGQVEAMLTSDDSAERAAATLERSRRIIRALKAE